MPAPRHWAVSAAFHSGPVGFPLRPAGCPSSRAAGLLCSPPGVGSGSGSVLVPGVRGGRSGRGPGSLRCKRRRGRLWSLSYRPHRGLSVSVSRVLLLLLRQNAPRFSSAFPLTHRLCTSELYFSLVSSPAAFLLLTLRFCLSWSVGPRGPPTGRGLFRGPAGGQCGVRPSATVGGVWQPSAEGPAGVREVRVVAGVRVSHPLGDFLSSSALC